MEYVVVIGKEEESSEGMKKDQEVSTKITTTKVPKEKLVIIKLAEKKTVNEQEIIVINSPEEIEKKQLENTANQEMEIDKEKEK